MRLALRIFARTCQKNNVRFWFVEVCTKNNRIADLVSRDDLDSVNTLVRRHGCISRRVDITTQVAGWEAELDE